MSVNGNRIVGPIDGIDCVLAARTINTSALSAERVYYTYVMYPGIGPVWIPQGFLDVGNLRHILINVNHLTKVFSASILDRRLQESSNFDLNVGIGSPDHEEIQPYGYLSASNDHLDVSKDKPKSEIYVKNPTQNRLFAGQWYVPTQNGTQIKLRAFKVTGPANLDEKGRPVSHFRRFDPSQIEIIDGEISFIPYTKDVSIFSNGSCNFADDKTTAMKFFDGWGSRNPKFNQKSCIGHLRKESKNCLFIGGLDNLEVKGYGDQLAKIACNRGQGYQIGDSCGTDSFGNCDSGKCVQIHGGFECKSEHAPVKFPIAALPHQNHPSKEKIIILIILAIFAAMILIALVAKYYHNKI